MSAGKTKDREADVWLDCKKAQTAYDEAQRRGLTTARRKADLGLSTGQIARILGRDYKKGKHPKARARVFRTSLESFEELCGLLPGSLEVPPESVVASPQAQGSADRPALAAAAFRIVPSPNTGANWKPGPSTLDEEKGYQFTGHFEAEADIDCDIRSISLHVMRNDHLAICVGPGKSSYYNGHLPSMEGKFGFVTIDGDRHYVDANYNFVRLFRYKAGQKFLFTIGRWCRAIGISRGELATQTLWYWIEDPTQMKIWNTATMA